MAGNKLDGRNPLAYMGVKPLSPSVEIISDRMPTAYDLANGVLNTEWLYKVDYPHASTSVKYVLASVERNIAVWIPMNGGSNGFSSITTQVFDTAGTFVYTPTAGTAYFVTEVVGAGGGAGGISSSLFQNNVYLSAGGGSGGYCKGIFSSSDVGPSQTIIVGAGGVGDSLGSAGSTGGTSSFGSFMSATGGSGSTYGRLGGSDVNMLIGGTGGTATGGYFNVSGQSGLGAYCYSAGTLVDTNLPVASGAGASSLYGAGAVPNAHLVLLGGSLVHIGGNDGNGNGSGGGGIICQSSVVDGNPATSGGSGTDGIVIVTEYIL